MHRPDGNWSLMLVNRNENNAHTIRVAFEDAAEKRATSFTGSVSQVTFGTDQYVWINDGPNSHPDPNLPPAAKSFPDATAQMAARAKEAGLSTFYAGIHYQNDVTQGLELGAAVAKKVLERAGLK